LRAIIDPNGATANPVDLVASATPEVYEQAVRIVLADEGVDTVLVINTHTYAAPPPAVAAVLPAAARGAGKPVLGCLLAAPDLPPLLPGAGDDADIPAYPSPEPAARAIARAATYAEWRRRPPGAVPDLAGFDVERARAVVEPVARRAPDGAWLSPDQVD